MNTGTQAAREAGNMVDLDSNPTKLIEVVEVGKQLLMTRGALTTFSIANDDRKDTSQFYLPYLERYMLFRATYYGPLAALNIMHLHSPQSAILSAIIFNALIIIALIPLALRRGGLSGTIGFATPAPQSSYIWFGWPSGSFLRHKVD